MGNYPVIVKLGEFKEGDLVSYIAVDTLVPVSHPYFKFLDSGKGRERERIKARKLRGTFSLGLIVPSPFENPHEGQSVTDALNLEKYLPPAEREYTPNHNPHKKDRKSETQTFDRLAFALAGTSTIAASVGLPIVPAVAIGVLSFATAYASMRYNRWLNKRPNYPMYDLDSFRKYSNVFQEGEIVWISEKIHGCVPLTCAITMADGTKRPLRDINIGDFILGMDESGRLIPSKVLNKFDNGPNEDKWLKIKGRRDNSGRGNSFFALTCTKDHEIYSPDLNRYTKASNLSKGDRVLSNRYDMGLSPIQEQILLGKMLGDGSLAIANHSANMRITHAEKDKEYLEWTMRGLGELDSGSRTNRISGYGSSMIDSRTINSSWIKNKFQSFLDADGVKEVPEWVEHELSPLALAFWYMDDGSLAHWEGQEDRANFATNAFTKSSCEVLVRALKRLGINSRIFESKGNRIAINSEDAEKLFLLVAPYIPRAMQRKLPERYRGHDGWLPGTDNTFKPSTVIQTIESIEEVDIASDRYDLETETHNYFAHGILIHNCNASFCHTGRRFHAKSRTVFRKDVADSPSIGEYQPKRDVYWKIAKKYDLQRKLKDHPGIVLYGEIYGKVQDLDYGVSQDEEVRFIAFDAMYLETRKYMDVGDFMEFCRNLDIPFVPTLYHGPFNAAIVEQLAEGKTMMPKAYHVREGVVVKPLIERRDNRIGRVVLKLAGQDYLLRKE